MTYKIVYRDRVHTRLCTHKIVYRDRVHTRLQGSCTYQVVYVQDVQDHVDLLLDWVVHLRLCTSAHLILYAKIVYIQDRIVRNVHTYAKPCTITYARCKIVYIQDGMQDVHISDLTGNMHTNRTWVGAEGLEPTCFRVYYMKFFFLCYFNKSKM